ncbi:unnamed protein product [Calicophoron daubneyi]|uniref:DNA ligase n=1 Tax=Calicophoron daubneyi TaxID=300641 RepID=A0AAV2T6R5_CALDB
MDVVNESDHIAKKVSFSTCCHLFDKLKTTSGTKAKKAILSRFVELWERQYATIPLASTSRPGAGRASFYPVLRLLLPQFDRARPAYGLRETSLARLYIKAFGIAPNGADAERLTHSHQVVSSTHKNVDFADVLYEVVKNRCREDSVLFLKDTHDLLDNLANSELPNDRLTHMNSLIRLATATEQKWIVRFIVRRESGCGLSGNSILQCLHPAALGLWDVTQDLIMLCQRIADIDPHSASTVEPSTAAPEVSLFVPFRPMLCERANGPDLLCSSALQLCSFGMDDLSDARLLLETKYDGERVQVHKSGNTYRYWSRNCLEWTASYGGDGNSGEGSLTPRLHSAFASHVQDCILDGEMMAFNTWTNCLVPKTAGFDVKRAAKQDDLFTDLSKSDEWENYQPCLIAFDLLYLNGEVLTNKPLIDRKHLLAEVFGKDPSANSVDADTIRSDNEQSPLLCPPPLSVLEGTVYLSGWCRAPISVDIVTKVFNNLMDYRQEGLAAKLAIGMAPYLPGRRLRGGWWKLKPDYVAGLLEDLDCLVVGGYYASGSHHTGKQAKIAEFLCAVRGEDIKTDDNSPSLPCFLSFCRVSNGLTNKMLKQIDEKLSAYWRPFDRKNPNSGFTEWLRVTLEKPDVWVAPQHSIALQIHASELVASGAYAAGLTGRFPRVVALRDDKSWQDCLTMAELSQLNTKTAGKLAVKRIRVDAGDEDSQGGEGTETKDLSSSQSESSTPQQHMDTDGPSSRPSGSTQKRRNFFGAPRASSTPIKRLRALGAALKSGGDSRGISALFTEEEAEKPAKYLEGLELCVILSSDAGSDLKSQLESHIRAAGGTVVQNPSRKTFCIVADKLTARTRNLIAGAKESYNIARVEWLLSSKAVNSLIAWKPTDLISMNSATASRLADQCDRFGDSFTEPVDTSSSRQLFSHMDSLSESSTSDTLSRKELKKPCEEEFGNDPSIVGALFGCNVMFLQLHPPVQPALSIGNLEIPRDETQFDSAELLTIDFRRLGAHVLDSLDVEISESENQKSVDIVCDKLSSSAVDGLTSVHFVILANPDPNVSAFLAQLRKEIAARQRLSPDCIYFVDQSWAVQCVEQQTLCVEEGHLF